MKIAMRLDDNYSIDTDGAGTVLNFQQQRQREKNKIMVDFLHKDQWFFLSLPQALNKYLDLKIEDSEDVKDCLKKIEEVRTIIKSINV
jgi:hypothetical protein